MLVIIQPSTRIPSLDTNREAADHARRLLEWRRASLDTLARRVLEAFPALQVALTESARRIEILPANGELIVDAPPDVVAGLQSTEWLHAFPDYQLPPLEVVSFPGFTGSAWHLKSIHKPSTLNGKGIVAGVVDSGINLAFPDHKTRSSRLGFGLFDGATGLVRSAPPVDLDADTSHGSLVCAFLAGATSGVSPAVHLNVAALPPVLDALTSVRVHRGLEWVATQTNPAGFARSMGCDVINLSVHIGWLDEWVPDLYDPLVAYRDQWGTFVVASIGNAMGSWTCPGAYDCVCAIGAVNAKDEIAVIANGLGCNDHAARRSIVFDLQTGD